VDVLWLFLVTYYIAPSGGLSVCLRSMLAVLKLAVFFFFFSQFLFFFKFLWVLWIYDIGRLVSFGFLAVNSTYMLQFYRARQKASLEDVAAMKCRACTNNILCFVTWRKLHYFILKQKGFSSIFQLAFAKTAPTLGRIEILQVCQRRYAKQMYIGQLRIYISSICVGQKLSG
jgi:hypothetical protein